MCFTHSFFSSAVSTITIAIICTGCAATSYVNPSFHDADYSSIKPVDSPRAVVISTIFQTNGKTAKEDLHKIVRRKVMKVLMTTRTFVEPANIATDSAGRLDITVNNIFNKGEAIRKGMATGATFYAAGNEVVDSYEMTVVYKAESGPSITKKYRHAIHSTLGAHKPPEGMTPLPLRDAFDKVLEDMLLNFLRDLQKEGSL